MSIDQASDVPQSSKRLRTIAIQGEPYLNIKYTSEYNWLYNDYGSGARRDLSIFAPVTSSADYFVIGHYALQNYGKPVSVTTLVQPVNGAESELLSSDGYFEEIWNDRGSGGAFDGSIWRFVPRNPDFIAIGFVGQSGYSTPNIPSYRAVHKSALQQENSAAAQVIWDTSHCRARQDVTLFSNPGVPTLFVAQQGQLSRFDGAIWMFKTP